MTNKTSLRVAIAAVDSGLIDELRKDALTTELATHLIDTCDCADTRKWETGIQPKDKKWVIVEQYKNKKDAIKGHQKWVDNIRLNPNIKLEDVMEYGI